jgi:deazaflavin-dependent oxidoreductase (nitroreductase family)
MDTTNTTNTTNQAGRRYLAPDRASRRILNPLMMSFIRLGVGVRGGRILHVRGRRSGEWRTVPVNPLTFDRGRYLVAPRGQTEWVRNLRAAGEGRLQLGRRYEEFTVTEIGDADKAPVIRAYLEQWAAETQRFFGDVTAASTDDEIAPVATGFPVFRIETR